MGLIKWVKDQYYNYRLSQADNKAKQGKLDDAGTIYSLLLGKQERAVVHFAKMLTKNADNAGRQLDNLRLITNMAEYVTVSTEKEYQDEMESLLSKMERKADECFKNKTFSTAVQLMGAILPFRSGTEKKDKYHRYKAFEQFEKSQGVTGYKTYLSSAVDEFQNISSLSSDDLQTIYSELTEQARYQRGVFFLSAFADKVDWINSSIVDSIVNIISGMDAEVRNPDRIASVCGISKLAKEASYRLAALADEYAKKKDFAAAVSLDKFASDYLSDNNEFNNNRCLHIAEELAGRAEAGEIKALLTLARDLQLSEAQVSVLIHMILKIAIAAEEVKSIKICQLFKQEKEFDKVYISKAKELCKRGKQSLINNAELLEIIKHNTTQDDYADCLGCFVPYISSFDKEYYNASISKIIREQNPELLKTYWSIKPCRLFIEKLVNISCPIYSQIVTYIISHHSVFLSNDGLKNVFCESVAALNDDEYLLSTLELLIKAGCDVENFYVKSIVAFVKETDEENAMLLYNRAIAIVKDSTLIDAKKALIRRYIAMQKYADAEREAKSLTAIDDESWTILAELYYAQAESSEEADERIVFLNKVLYIDKSCQLKESFADRRTAALSELSSIAADFHSWGNSSAAYKICENISNYPKEWLGLFIALRQLDYSTIRPLGERINFQESTLRTVNEKVDKEVAADSVEYNDLWKQLADLYMEKSECQPKNKAIDSLDWLRDSIMAHCSRNTADLLAEKITELLSKIRWTYGLELEHEQCYDKAIELYDSTVAENVPLYGRRAEIRSLICHVKADKIDDVVESAILKSLEEKSFEALREDLAYRYVCYLIKNVRPGDAESIIKTYIPSEKDLLDICMNLHVREAEMKLCEFNGRLSRLADGSMSADSALQFLNEMDVYRDFISVQLPDITDKFVRYKDIVRAYILKLFFDNEDYVNAYKTLVRMYPYFMDDATAYRNIAVASIGIIESDLNDEQMLRRAVSIALSAIYTDKLFIASLDQTSWDDQYEFTLKDSLGRSSEDDNDELPDNVNFSSPVENRIISIKDVQNNLLMRIETAVRALHPSLENYYNKEKKALEQLLCLNLDQRCCIATPGLAESEDDIRKSIKEALDYEYNQGFNNQEDVLSVGLNYGFRNGEYKTYEMALAALDKCKQALNADSIRKVQAAYRSSIISSIKSFDKLYADLQAACSSSMNSAVSSKMPYDKFLDFYEVVCKAVDDVRLAMACANYVNGEIVRRLNDNSMKLRDGIGYMVRIYNLAPSNVQVKGNLVGILSNLVIEAEQSGNRLDAAALSNAQQNLGGRFDSTIEEIRIQIALSKIIDKVNNNAMNDKDALQEMYSLYIKSPDDDRICQNLVTLCDRCIMEYVAAENGSDSGSVCSVLDALKNNGSVTFKRHAKVLVRKYEEIIAQVPYDTLMLIEKGFGNNPNLSLNSNGLRLKKALQYYKTLGGNYSSAGSIFDGMGLGY